MGGRIGRDREGGREGNVGKGGRKKEERMEGKVGRGEERGGRGKGGEGTEWSGGRRGVRGRGGKEGGVFNYINTPKGSPMTIIRHVAISDVYMYMYIVYRLCFLSTYDHTSPTVSMIILGGFMGYSVGRRILP